MTNDSNKNGDINKIRLIVADSLALEPDSIAADSHLITQLGADSLDFTDIMFQLESEFDVALQKENFNFLEKAGVDTENLELDKDLEHSVKQKIKQWLPELPLDEAVRPADLRQYITIETLYYVVTQAADRNVKSA